MHYRGTSVGRNGGFQETLLGCLVTSNSFENESTLKPIDLNIYVYRSDIPGVLRPVHEIPSPFILRVNFFFDHFY